ncbi:21224_t:CDS:2 [Entrophospora sp. SA101]|nr:21224_t:CDS:2 [Entrophospora sp. SA101]
MHGFISNSACEEDIVVEQQLHGKISSAKKTYMKKTGCSGGAMSTSMDTSCAQYQDLLDEDLLTHEARMFIEY